ncbi:ATP-binding protein [Rhizobium sp. 11515TR]|uniref:ATP-binding protein n=1 Tax=Rhizobium sp. 11515TR TaxID=2028343 RepID=UPI000BA88FA2|nr:ATP-binding protein [Rhizobium sp. 11515TR]ASW08643.1 hypothetical protein CKA34_21880 [Rhizobium sp. 11515TR]
MSEQSRNYLSRELLRKRVTAKIIDRAALLQDLSEVYVTTDRDREMTMELEVMIAHMLNPNTRAGYAVAVTGPSGAGKSTLVNQRLDATTEFETFDDGYGNDVEFCLRVQTPSSCTALTLGTAILTASGYPLQKMRDEDEVWRTVRNRLQRKMHKVIFLDEFQHVLKGSQAKGAAHLTNQIKLLMQDPDWPVWLIIAGIPDIMEFVNRDVWQQADRRIGEISIDGLTDTEGDIEQTREMIKVFAETCKLKLALPLLDDFIRQLMHGALWRFGISIQLTKRSIESALWDEKGNSSLSHAHFVDGYRRLSRCTRVSNVFMSPDWRRIQREIGRNGKLTSSFKLLDRELERL